MDPAVFFTPHQDDETLSMGASIVQHVAAGRQVIVVLLTDGGASGVRSLYPSDDVFIGERDREFNAAVKRMGGTPVIRADRAHDGQLTIDYAQSVIQEYVDQYPAGSFKTMSEFDASPDHSNLGKALKNVSGTKDKRWYVKRTEWGTTGGTYTDYYDLNQVFLDYAPVGWLSVYSEFRAGFVQTRNKIYYY
jgi:LmbE family N-acetylglucosaminyl deacetylase